MKKILAVSFMLWVGFAAAVFGGRTKGRVSAISRMDILYLKLDKDFVGAELEIYSEDGVKLFTEKIGRRKVLVDFYYETPGKYIIHLTKGESAEKIDFVKSSPCPESGDLTTSITVAQGL